MTTELTDALHKSFTAILDSAAEVVPKIIFLLLLLLVGWLVAKGIGWGIKKALNAIKLQSMMDKVELSPILSKIGITDIAATMGKLGFWMVMTVVLITAAESLQLDMISQGLSSIIAYLPKLFSAVIILLIGMLFANLVKRMVYSATNSIGLSGAQIIANIVYYVLFVFIFITAISQTGIDTSLITSNVTLIFAAILLAFAVSYGFASKDIMTNMLSSFYSKDKYRIGMQLEIGGTKGTIVAIDNLSVTLENAEGKVVIPMKRLLTEEIRILSDK